VIPRQNFVLKHKSGRGAYEMLRKKRPSLMVNKTLPAFVGFQQPVNKKFTLGKGKVFNLGFFPGISYHSSSTGRKLAAPTSAADGSDGVAVADGDGKTLVREYPQKYRDYIKSLKLPVTPGSAAMSTMWKPTYWKLPIATSSCWRISAAKCKRSPSPLTAKSM
jgi:hypothetical protein